MNGEQRIATYLLHLRERNAAREDADPDLLPPMALQEFADLLALTLAIVHRILSKFKKERLIIASGRQIRIIDLDGLKQRAL
jgi:CRP/FNR family transcriptional regulator